jgi:hypothetical protein
MVALISASVTFAPVEGAVIRWFYAHLFLFIHQSFKLERVQKNILYILIDCCSVYCVQYYE